MKLKFLNANVNNNRTVYIHTNAQGKEREIERYMITRNTISFSLFPVGGFSAIRTKTYTLSDYCYCTKNHLPETDD